MFIDAISGIISVSWKPGRDVHHGTFCPLPLIVSGNEHRHAVTAMVANFFPASRE
jgi:hypothetical protein